ncbi:MAG: hypothetical protein ABFR95_07340 [Actinomycetota bacterium]
MTFAIVLGLAILVAVMVMLSRQASSTKKQAIADLEREQKDVGKFDILDLVESEVDGLGLLDVDGAADLPHGVLLKAWKDNQDVVDSCAGREFLRYVVADGADLQNITHADVTLECSNRRAETPPEN